MGLVKILDQDLEQYGARVHEEVFVGVKTQTRKNVAVRCDTGEEILLSVIDCGDHLSIDVTVYNEAGEVRVKTWGLENGRGTEPFEAPLTILMAPRPSVTG